MDGMDRVEEEYDLMLPKEVARLFRVDRKTVNRWAEEGKISCVRTPGGHRRFSRTEVEELLYGKFKEAAAQG